MPIDLDLFMRHMRGDQDLVGVFLRAHLWVEQLLADLITVKLERPEVLNVGRWQFAQKINLALALGILDDAEAAPMKLMGKIRNRLAHDLNGEPTAEEIRHLEGALSERQRTPLEAITRLHPRGAAGNDRNRLEYAVHAILVMLESDKERLIHSQENEAAYYVSAVLKVLNGRIGPEKTEEEIAAIAKVKPWSGAKLWVNASPTGYDEHGNHLPRDDD